MARFTHTRVASRSVLGKRKASGTARRPFKKRRFVRSRRSSAFGSHSSAGQGRLFRSKKVVRKRWNSMLWNSTLQKQHYRSISSTSNSQATPGGAPTMAISQYSALNLTGNFYNAAGGAQAVDAAVPVPVFQDDIIIRGGMLKLTLTNEVASSEPIKVIVFLVKTGTSSNFALLPITAPISWDPSIVIEWNRNIGKIMLRREFLIENSNVNEITWRLPVQKMDPSMYQNGLMTYHWIVCTNSPAGGAVNLIVVRSFNLSFVGDAV